MPSDMWTWAPLFIGRVDCVGGGGTAPDIMLDIFPSDTGVGKERNLAGGLRLPPNLLSCA
jgi:hypothetical protein